MARAAHDRVPLHRRLLSARGRTLEITTAGTLFILLTLAVGFAAINSGSNLLHVVFGAQMALIIGSGILSESVVRRVTAHRHPVGALHAATPGLVRVEVRNTDPRRQVFSISVEDDPRRRHEGACGPAFAVRLAGGERSLVDCPLLFPRRGRHPIPPAVVATRFPFGLFIKRRQLETSRTVLVFPCISPVSAQQLAQLTTEGTLTGSKSGRGGEFFSLREYRAGDEIRRMHWPAVARTNKLVVREDQDTRTTTLVLPVPSGRTGDAAFEAAIERTASIAVAALRRGAAVGLGSGGKVLLLPRQGTAHALDILATLAELGGPWPEEARPS